MRAAKEERRQDRRTKKKKAIRVSDQPNNEEGAACVAMRRRRIRVSDRNRVNSEDTIWSVSPQEEHDVCRRLECVSEEDPRVGFEVNE